MAHLISIGNSKGVRLPKHLIEQAHLEGKELSIELTSEGILLRPIKEVRQGWKEAFAALAHSPLSEEEQQWLETDLSETIHEEWEW